MFSCGACTSHTHTHSCTHLAHSHTDRRTCTCTHFIHTRAHAYIFHTPTCTHISNTHVYTHTCSHAHTSHTHTLARTHTLLGSFLSFSPLRREGGVESHRRSCLIGIGVLLVFLPHFLFVHSLGPLRRAACRRRSFKFQPVCRGRRAS